MDTEKVIALCRAAVAAGLLYVGDMPAIENMAARGDFLLLEEALICLGRTTHGYVESQPLHGDDVTEAIRILDEIDAILGPFDGAAERSVFA